MAVAGIGCAYFGTEKLLIITIGVSTYIAGLIMGMQLTIEDIEGKDEITK